MTLRAEAQPQEVATLILAGRNLDAVDLARRTFENASAADRQPAFQLAAWVCVTLSDLACARDVLALTRDPRRALAPADVQPATAGYSLLLWAFAEIAGGNIQSTAYVLGDGFPIGLVNALRDPVLFAELKLLAARRSRLALDFEASREHLDRALASTLSLNDQRFDAQRLLVRIAGQLLDNYDTERALRLVAAAAPLLETIPAETFLAFEFLQMRSVLAGYRKDFGEASRDLRQAITNLGRLQLRPAQKSFLEASAANELLGTEVLRGDRDAARTLLESHPLAAARTAIVKRGYFADESEFNFAVADEFARTILKDSTETGWNDLLRLPVRWTTDAERLQETEAFGQAAFALHLLRTGKAEEARRHFIDAGRKRLVTLQERYRKSIFASPLPYWTDQLLLEFAIAAMFPPGGTPDDDFLLGAHVVLSRTIATSSDDALATQAAQESDDNKRVAQSLRTVGYQRAAWEKAGIAALVERLASPARQSPEASIQVRLHLLRLANDFAVHQQRLRTALVKNATGSADSVASLATAKASLAADEALVFYVPRLGTLGKVCVRRDRTKLSAQSVDAATLASDVQLVSAALTATDPASLEADSQFPAVEAVRLGKLLFGGLEDCLGSSRRIYHVAPDGLVAQVPPAALLAEVPPPRGSGYDLRSAHWLVRDHAFVRTSSIDAFVATKRLARSRRATLDYLGVGDPVLASTVRTGLGALPELPEASEEIGQVASLFAQPKVRVLRREAATEEAFRLQPLSEFDVVHLATHGLVRDELPGLPEPSLVFTPPAHGDAFNDGLLTSSQIAALPLRARLVVLSACNSARYAPSIIDSGIQGLSTSFAIAGVPSMVASLWPIESTLTRDLIIDVFRSARGSGGVGIADALAIAMRRHLDGPAPRPLLHPRFWAALVVLGDGSMALGDAAAVPRDLGPFAAIDPARDEEFLSAVPLDGDVATSLIGAWNGKRSPSLIQRQALDGTVRWQVSDGDIGAGLVAATDHTIFAAGYLSFPQGDLVRSVPVLRGLTPDGKLMWSHRLPAGPRSTMVMGLATAPDRSAIALVGPTIGAETQTEFSLIRVDGEGAERELLPLTLTGNARSWLSGLLAIDEAKGLAIINRGPRPADRPRGYNGFGLPEFCRHGDEADIVLLDVLELKEQRHLRIDGFRAASALAAKDGWIVTGDARSDDCLASHATVYKIGSDGSVTSLWRDSSPFDTFGRGIRKVAGAIEIIGYARRSIAIQDEAPAVAVVDFSAKRLGSEAWVSGEVFSVRLSDQGMEQRRDSVGAGLPVFPQGIVESGDRSAIFGTVGSRPLWMAR